MDKLLATFAFVVLAGFVGILIWHVPRLDLIAVVALTLALAGWDLIKGLRRS
jgi:hypothetical protein